jgi:hypothetical protein
MKVMMFSFLIISDYRGEGFHIRELVQTILKLAQKLRAVVFGF